MILFLLGMTYCNILRAVPLSKGGIKISSQSSFFLSIGVFWLWSLISHMMEHHDLKEKVKLQNTNRLEHPHIWILLRVKKKKKKNADWFTEIKYLETWSRFLEKNYGSLDLLLKLLPSDLQYPLKRLILVILQFTITKHVKQTLRPHTTTSGYECRLKANREATGDEWYCV